jgi:hypothetical protein
MNTIPQNSAILAAASSRADELGKQPIKDRLDERRDSGRSIAVPHFRRSWAQEAGPLRIEGNPRHCECEVQVQPDFEVCVHPLCRIGAHTRQREGNKY